MEYFSTYHLKRWVEQNKELFAPPYKTNRALARHGEFIVMILHGPNERFTVVEEEVEPGIHCVSGLLTRGG